MMSDDQDSARSRIFRTRAALVSAHAIDHVWASGSVKPEEIKLLVLSPGLKILVDYVHLIVL